MGLLGGAVLFGTARAHRHTPEVETAEQLADRPLGQPDPVALRDLARQIDPPPAHHAMLRKARALPNQFSHLPRLLSRKTRPRAWSRSVGKSRQALRIVAVNPIAQGLPIHPAGRRRLDRDLPSITSASANIRRAALASAARAAATAPPSNPSGSPQPPPSLASPESKTQENHAARRYKTHPSQSQRPLVLPRKHLSYDRQEISDAAHDRHILRGCS